MCVCVCVSVCECTVSVLCADMLREIIEGCNIYKENPVEGYIHQRLETIWCLWIEKGIEYFPFTWYTKQCIVEDFHSGLW